MSYNANYQIISKEVFYINKTLNNFFYFITIFTILICVFFVPQNTDKSNVTIIDFIDDGSLLWPTPGIHQINCHFGKRKAPTTGASTYHKGIDIGAPEGFEFVAVTDGTITYTGFLGGGGYTITLTDNSSQYGKVKYTYCHCNPNFIVDVGTEVVKGQIIGKVGPKYVEGVPRKQIYR